MNRLRVFIILMLVLFGAQSALAKSGDADFHFRIKNEIFKKVIKQIKSHFVEKDGYLKKSIPSQSVDLKIDLSNHADVEDAHYYASSIMGINLKGENKVKFLVEKPYFQGKLQISAPRFYAIDKAGSKLKVKLDITLENYYLYFKHIWFAEKGFTQSSSTADNNQSCQKLIMEDRYQGNDLDVATYKSEYEAFFKQVDNSEFYKTIKNNLFVRVDHFQLGWGNYHHTQRYGDNRNKLKVAVEAIVDLSPGAQTISLTKLDQNFGKKGGSWLPVHIPEKNIIIPPIMIRTTRPVVDAQGYFVKDEDGNQVNTVRCTPVKMDVAKEMATEVVKKFSNQLPTYLNDDLIKTVVSGVNEQLASMKMDIPSKLLIHGDEFSDYEEKETEYLGNVYVYKVPKKVTGDLKEQVKKIIGDFYNYRAALGLYGIQTSHNGSHLTMAINGGLVIDDKEIAYRERDSKVSYANNFKFPNHNRENMAFSINRDMIQRIANIVRDRYLSTNIPEIVNININDNSIIIDKDGYLVFKPELVVKVKGYEVVSIPGLEVKVKLGFYTSKKDGRRKFLINLDIPNGNTVISKVKTGSLIKKLDIATDIVLLNPITWPLIPFKNRVVKPTIKKTLANIVNKYIKEVQDNYTVFDINDIVTEYGVTPRYFIFHKEGHAAIYLDFNKVVGIDETLEEFSNKLDEEINNFKLDLDLKF